MEKEGQSHQIVKNIKDRFESSANGSKPTNSSGSKPVTKKRYGSVLQTVKAINKGSDDSLPRGLEASCSAEKPEPLEPDNDTSKNDNQTHRSRDSQKLTEIAPIAEVVQTETPLTEVSDSKKVPPTVAPKPKRFQSYERRSLSIEPGTLVRHSRDETLKPRDAPSDSRVTLPKPRATSENTKDVSLKPRTMIAKHVRDPEQDLKTIHSESEKTVVRVPEENVKSQHNASEIVAHVPERNFHATQNDSHKIVAHVPERNFQATQNESQEIVAHVPESIFQPPKNESQETVPEEKFTATQNGLQTTAARGPALKLKVPPPVAKKSQKYKRTAGLQSKGGPSSKVAVNTTEFERTGSDFTTKVVALQETPPTDLQVPGHEAEPAEHEEVNHKDFKMDADIALLIDQEEQPMVSIIATQEDIMSQEPVSNNSDAVEAKVNLEPDVPTMQTRNIESRGESMAPMALIQEFVVPPDGKSEDADTDVAKLEASGTEKKETLSKESEAEESEPKALMIDVHENQVPKEEPIKDDRAKSEPSCAEKKDILYREDTELKESKPGTIMDVTKVNHVQKEDFNKDDHTKLNKPQSGPKVMPKPQRRTKMENSRVNADVHDNDTTKWTSSGRQNDAVGPSPAVPERRTTTWNPRETQFNDQSMPINNSKDERKPRVNKHLKQIVSKNLPSEEESPDIKSAINFWKMKGQPMGNVSQLKTLFSEERDVKKLPKTALSVQRNTLEYHKKNKQETPFEVPKAKVGGSRSLNWKSQMEVCQTHQSIQRCQQNDGNDKQKSRTCETDSKPTPTRWNNKWRRESPRHQERQKDSSMANKKGVHKIEITGEPKKDNDRVCVQNEREVSSWSGKVDTVDPKIQRDVDIAKWIAEVSASEEKISFIPESKENYIKPARFSQRIKDTASVASQAKVPSAEDASDFTVEETHHPECKATRNLEQQREEKLPKKQKASVVQYDFVITKRDSRRSQHEANANKLIFKPLVKRAISLENEDTNAATSARVRDASSVINGVRDADSSIMYDPKNSCNACAAPVVTLSVKQEHSELRTSVHLVKLVRFILNMDRRIFSVCCLAVLGFIIWVCNTSTYCTIPAEDGWEDVF